MCGIAGIYLKDPQDQKLPPEYERESFINELLRGIEQRGRDATGLVALQNASTQPHLEKADIEASEFIKWRKPLPLNSRIVLLHTRAATKGSPTNLDNNHPVVHKTCYVTHNGHIRNDDDLFDTNAITRIAQVDSEIIPALIDKHGLDKVHLALQELEGGFAIAAVQPEKHPDVLVLAKGRNSPLEFIETEQAIVWASTITAIRDAWKKLWGDAPEFKAFTSLKEGELLYIEDGKVEKLEFKVKQPVQTRSTWSGTNTYTGYGYGQTGTLYSGTGSYLSRYCDSKNHRRTCKCGHSQWKHGGAAMDGLCLKGDCRCLSFSFQRFLTKREWRKHEDYKRVQEDRKKLDVLRAAEKKNRAEEARRREAEKSWAAEFPDIKGKLRIVYQGGERRVFDNERVVAVQFRCDGCTEWKGTKGSEKHGHFRLCVECWGEECDMCQEFFAPDTLTKVEVGDTKPEEWFLCTTCYNAVNTASDEDFDKAVTEAEEGKEVACEVIIPRGQARGFIDGLTVDDMCITLTAEEVGCNPSFMYELLFDMDSAEIISESWLEQAYIISSTAYRKNLLELRQGLPSTTSKALALFGSEDAPRSVREAVIAGGESPNGGECGVRVFTDE